MKTLRPIKIVWRKIQKQNIQRSDLVYGFTKRRIKDLCALYSRYIRDSLVNN
jgi:protein-tyrosine-phosphatase